LECEVTEGNNTDEEWCPVLGEEGSDSLIFSRVIGVESCVREVGISITTSVLVIGDVSIEGNIVLKGTKKGESTITFILADRVTVALSIARKVFS